MEERRGLTMFRQFAVAVLISAIANVSRGADQALPPTPPPVPKAIRERDDDRPFPATIGDSGHLSSQPGHGTYVLQVISKTEALVRWKPMTETYAMRAYFQPFLLRGVDTDDMADDCWMPTASFSATVTGTYKYETADGGSKSVFVVEPTEQVKRRDAVDNTFKPEALAIGQWGNLNRVHVVQVLDARRMLVRALFPDDTPLGDNSFLLSGFPTTVDGVNLTIGKMVKVIGTYDYNTVSNSRRRVFAVRVFTDAEMVELNNAKARQMEEKARRMEEIEQLHQKVFAAQQAKEQLEAEARKALEEAAKWHTYTISSRPVDAKFVKMMGGTVYMVNRKGEEIKVQTSDLTPDDLQWIRNRGRQKTR